MKKKEKIFNIKNNDSDNKNRIEIFYEKFKYSNVYIKNNIKNNKDIKISYFDSFYKQKNNFIFGVKIFYNNLNNYKIIWKKNYSTIAAAIIENEFENKNRGWEVAKKIYINNKYYDTLNEDIINYILNSEDECIIYGSYEYVDIASKMIWYLTIKEEDTLEEELKRQNIIL